MCLVVSGTCAVGKTTWIKSLGREGEGAITLFLTDFADRIEKNDIWRDKGASSSLSTFYHQSSWIILFQALSKQFSVVDRHPFDDALYTHLFEGHIKTMSVYDCPGYDRLWTEVVKYPTKICHVIFIEPDAAANTARRVKRNNSIDGKWGEDYVHQQNVLFLNMARYVPVNNRFIVVGTAWGVSLGFLRKIKPEPGVFYSQQLLTSPFYGMEIEPVSSEVSCGMMKYRTCFFE